MVGTAAEPSSGSPARVAGRASRGRPTARPIGHLKHHAYGDPAAASRLELAELAWLQVARITSSAHEVTHLPPPTMAPSVAIALQLSGTSVLAQHGRTARVMGGYWSICHSAEQYTLVGTGASRRLVLLMPSVHIAQGIDLRWITARAFPGTSGVSRLAFGAADWLIEEISALGLVRAEELAESLCRLMNLAIRERTREPMQRNLGERIRDYVAHRLRDPDLSIASIARDLRASKSSLHRAILNTDGSIHNLIWHTRLERCRQDLLDPQKLDHSIAQIAHSWGFKDVTHFSHAFRHRFGMSARQMRAAHRRAPA